MALCSTIAATPSMKKLSCERRSLRLPHHSSRLRKLGNAENLFVVRANSNETWTKLNVTDKISKAEPPYVPVYIGLPLGIIDTDGDLVDPYVLKNQLRILKSIDVDGVMVNCWWGIVEGHAPKQYNWTGYKKLFQFVREHCLKLQVVMSFHGCGENIGDDVHIPLPRWVMELGSNNPEIFFTDSEGRRNHECLTWGVDYERVLLGRTPVRVYFDFMQSFREEFDEFFVDGVISGIEIGLGPSGELRYPSHPTKHGWKYPGIGEFQCHDKYLMTSLKNAAKVRGVPEWGRGPDNVGSYNSKPQETKFFCDRESDFFGYRIDYDSCYGRFFLKWYSQVLIDHGDLVLAWANIAFVDTPLTVKLPIIDWWYNTNSQAAELTAGFYNSAFKEGYGPITSMLKTHAAALKFPCVDLQTSKQYKNFPNALGTPKEVLWQVVNAALESDIPIASENGLTCYDREGYNKLLEKAIPFDNPDRIPLRDFTYQRLGTDLLTKKINIMEFERFVKRMHGELEYEYF